ncbi:hypothetical protein PP-LIT1_gp55 [Pseudomonas phage LIT1]|uniref:Uncharacterized protein n=3 Tax=Litunavirus TaxID=1920762 RepID=A0A0A7NRL3_9CAUD|nr:hypothetical protein PP-LIT1_gp55 [Pseudomonas phage LIT1]YP_009148235.1 hypothetical protein ACQ21_gp55 [Pseudomonas phage Pa2]AIZ94988.1 hypothetical protein [Pseudomonas phage phi176]QWT71811.1 hypothetical protein [Pseudomonas phage vB_Pae-PA14]AIZ94897.1 hypothetical protein [Pseudomonas phage Pa2]CAZ66311.1 hypothetical protein [Pseudomonas phage LIT1]
MSYGFRFYDADGNVTVDSTNKSFRSVYRQQVFPTLQGAYTPMPPGFDPNTDFFFLTWFHLNPDPWPRFVDFSFINNQIRWLDDFAPTYGRAYLNVVSFR